MEVVLQPLQPALLIGANVPDVDVVTSFAGTYASLAMRRGWTHGAPAVVVWPILVTGLLLAWDRVRRRPVLIAGDLGRAIVLGSVPAAGALDSLTLGHLYAVAFASGVLTLFFDVSRGSYLPAVAGREHLVEANSRLACQIKITAELDGLVVRMPESQR